jgi:aminoglycoside phosphotransferase (APT) family kinase protein
VEPGGDARGAVTPDGVAGSVSEAPAEIAGIDVDGVTQWFVENIDGVNPPLRFTRIKGGHSNLTYEINDEGDGHYVLRRPPLGDLLPTAHDMSREWRFISALHPTNVPVPPPLGYYAEKDVTGASFYVMAFVDGHVLHDASVAEQQYDESQRRSTGESFIDVLADMHKVDPDDVGLGDIARKEGYIERQLKRWYSQWNASKTRELPEIDEVHDALAARIPEQGPARVAHGDYRLGNCITSFDGRIAAVLDWEIATLGDPLADVGYVLHSWPEPGEGGPAHRMSPTVVPGYPTRDELLERYAKRSGRDVSQIDFYVAFCHWKSACIVEGVYARYLHGALDTTGVNVDAFKLSVEMAARTAAQSLERMR